MKKSVAAVLIILALFAGYVFGNHFSLVKEAQAGPISEVKSHIDRTTRVACYYTNQGISCVNIDRVQ
jgi:hypothetical protein